MFKATTILKEVETYLPDLKELSSSFRQEIIPNLVKRLDRKAFLDCPNVSIDVAVMEKTKNAYVLPFNGGWSDVGVGFVWSISKRIPWEMSNKVM